MHKLPASSPSKDSLILLSRLLLAPPENCVLSSISLGVTRKLTEVTREEFDDAVTLANSNHVIVRAMEVFLQAMREAGDGRRAEWAESALSVERARIRTAMAFLRAVCDGFVQQGYDVTVIKSLDHWPDLGSDLDLYTNAGSEHVVQMMKDRFQARIAPRSWGDRLACKWNFLIPGLPEAIEIHMGRLGQTGEQLTISAALAGRARQVLIEDQAYRVAAVSDRLMISTLQRMYRHFYFRLCDIVDTAELSESGAIDYQDLRSSADAAGIWEGVATYLVIVSDYVKQYRGRGIDLPEFVRAAARFGGDLVYFARGFLRVPILPQSAGLYGSQLTGLLRKRELQSSARLGLLPWLATAALVGQKITGSDKGIW